MTYPISFILNSGVPSAFPATYPVQLDLNDRPVLVVGAGRVAAAKINKLTAAGARVTVVAPDAVPAVANRTDIAWLRRRYRQGEVAAYRLGVTTTGDASVDSQVFADGERAGVFINSADDTENCSFILPAVARRSTISVTVGTEGRSPALASWLRGRFQTDLDNGMEDLLTLLAGTRTELRARTGSSEHPGWRTALDDDLLELVRDNNIAVATERLRHALGLPTHDTNGSTGDSDSNSESRAGSRSGTPRSEGLLT